MGVFSILPHSMLGTLYQGEGPKVVKMRLQADKRLPKHSQEGYNVFILPTQGALQVDITDCPSEQVAAWDILQICGENEFSLYGCAAENPFLYFIVPQTDTIETRVLPYTMLNCCYKDDVIEWSRFLLLSEGEPVTLHSPGDEYFVLCATGEATVHKEDETRIYRLMKGDALHVDGYQTIHVHTQQPHTLICVACLRLA